MSVHSCTGCTYVHMIGTYTYTYTHTHTHTHTQRERERQTERERTLFMLITSLSPMQAAYLGVVFSIPFSISNPHQYPVVQTCSGDRLKDEPDVYFGYFSVAHVGLCAIETILFLIQFSLLYQLRRKGYYKFFNSTWWLLGIPLVLSVFGEYCLESPCWLAVFGMYCMGIRLLWTVWWLLLFSP